MILAQRSLPPKFPSQLHPKFNLFFHIKHLCESPVISGKGDTLSHGQLKASLKFADGMEG